MELGTFERGAVGAAVAVAVAIADGGATNALLFIYFESTFCARLSSARQSGDLLLRDEEKRVSPFRDAIRRATTTRDNFVVWTTLLILFFIII